MGNGVHAWECHRCSGLWLPEDSFHAIVHQAKERVAKTAQPGARASQASANTKPSPSQQEEGSFYRPCPVCSQFMNRKNYGGVSGVVVDTCKDHGIWFDANELNHVLKHPPRRNYDDDRFGGGTRRDRGSATDRPAGHIQLNNDKS